MTEELKWFFCSIFIAFLSDLFMYLSEWHCYLCHCPFLFSILFHGIEFYRRRRRTSEDWFKFVCEIIKQVVHLSVRLHSKERDRNPFDTSFCAGESMILAIFHVIKYCCYSSNRDELPW